MIPSLFRLTFLFAFLALFSGDSKAASGYYINLNGDTVRGNFSNLPETGNPSRVDFIPGGSTEVMVLRPGDVRGFRVGNYDFYLSYSGPRLLNSGDGSGSSGSSVDTITTFLRDIGETGGYTFYSYSDSKRVNLFYTMGDDRVDELRNISSTPMKGDYRDQLNIMLSSKVDTSVLYSMVKKLDYSEEGMINFIDELNELTSEHTVPAFKGFVATVGYSYNIFSASGSNAIPAVSTNYKEGGSWLVGFGYIKPLRKGGGQYFIYPNIKAFNYETSGTITRYNGVATTSYSSDLVLYPAFNVGFHLVNKAAFKFFLSPGFGFLILMNNTEENNFAFYDGTSENTSTEKTEFTFDVNLKTGVVLLNRFMIWAAYNIPTPTSDSEYNKTTYTGNLSGFQGGIGVKF